MRTRSMAVAGVMPFLLALGCSGGGAAGTGTTALAAAGGRQGSAASGGASSNATASGERGHFAVRNLVSDGTIAAEHTDANLVNAWGLSALPTSPWWISDNGTGKTTLYDGEGVARPLVVAVAGAGGPAAPTGTVANADTTAFQLTSGGATAAGRFLFASEDGTISGWNPAVPTAGSTTTVVMVDHSASGAVYKGLALATTSGGPRLYATDFHDGTVETFDGAWAPVATAGFIDPNLPAGFAPFGIAAIGGEVVVTYALQDADRHDDVAGAGLGIVSAFGTDGTFHRRIATRGALNSPWGLAAAPATFGRAGGMLLVGNFGDGRIHAFRWPGGRGSGGKGDATAQDHGSGGDGMGGQGDGEGDDEGGRVLRDASGPIVIDGLWGLGFGNGAASGPVDALYFTAGPDGEAHGLFGRIDWVPGVADGGD